MPKAIGLYFELTQGEWCCGRAETLADVYSLLLCMYPSDAIPNLRPVEVRPRVLFEGALLPPMGFLPPDRPEKPPLHL